MNHFIVGTAGHVDHGKTALIKALTGIDCDTHREEQSRGITINLGFAHLEITEDLSLGIVDVPGHKDFIRTMISGAHGIDMVLLVVAADEGIKPQTIEHLRIIQMLGIEKGVVAITKTDLADDDLTDLAMLEVEEVLENTSLKGMPVVKVSARTGKGIDELKNELAGIILETDPKDPGKGFRMYIDRMFEIKGVGIVVTGSVINGRVKTGSELFPYPGTGKKIRVRRIQRHGKEVEHVIAGDRAAMQITGIKMNEIEKGMVLLDREMQQTTMIDALITVFEDIKLGLWSNVVFLSGTYEGMARIHLLDRDEAGKDDKAIAQIHLEKPFVFVNKDRFIFRNTSNDLTLGGGIIFNVLPYHHKRRPQKLISQLREEANAVLFCTDLSERIVMEIKKMKRPATVQEVAMRIDIPQDELIDRLRSAEKKGIKIYKNDKAIILSLKIIDQYLKKDIERIISEQHKEYPLDESGLSLKKILSKLRLPDETGFHYLNMVLQNMQAEGIVKMVEHTWALADHRIIVDEKNATLLEWIENRFMAYGNEKSDLTEVEREAGEKGCRGNMLKMMMEYLVKQKILYFYDGEYIHSSVVDTSRKSLLKELLHNENGINEKELRELTNTTKKLTQILLGIYINEGIVTKRSFFIYITEKGRDLMKHEWMIE